MNSSGLSHHSGKLRLLDQADHVLRHGHLVVFIYEKTSLTFNYDIGNSRVTS